MELKQYENNTKYNERVFENLDGFDGNGSGVIPATTRLQIGISTNSTASNVRGLQRIIRSSIYACSLTWSYMSQQTTIPQ